MASSFKYPQVGHDKHNNINDNPGENVKAMETGNGKKEIGKIGAGLRPVLVHKWISAPPCAFSVHMGPFPCLAA